MTKRKSMFREYQVVFVAPKAAYGIITDVCDSGTGRYIIRVDNDFSIFWKTDLRALTKEERG